MRTRAQYLFHRCTVIAALCALIAGVVHVTPARAAAIVINTNADVVNSGDGLCSLREAIVAANTDTASGPGAGECAAGSGADTISFAANYTITLAPAFGQLPNVTSQITVNGRGVANTIIQAHASPNTANARVFLIGSAANLTLNALSVRNGRCNGSCVSLPDGGGGIYNAGTLTLRNSVIAANWVGNIGGGIYNGGTLIVTRSTFSGNSAGGYGGGIYLGASAATTNVTSSTFSGNSSANRGGGISSSGTLTVMNSTFSGNSASVAGGGIDNAAGTTTVTNGTFSGNYAGIAGGGIYKAGGAVSVTVKNTIVANSPAGGNCSGDITNGGNNLDSGATCLWGSNNGSLSNTDPRLGPVANNGGPTQTMALLAGSPAIGTGTNVGCPATDQRGVTRPQGSQCDLGAYEANPSASLRTAGAQDGWVLETSENSNLGGTVNAAQVTFNLGDNASNRQYRAILHFNTAALPDNAVIVKAVLRIRRHDVIGTNPFTTHGKVAVDIRKGAFSNNPLLQATDFQAPANRPGVGLIANNPTTAGWYSVNLNAASFPFVHRTGTTQLRLRFQTDDDNDAAADFLRFYSGNAISANQPVLVISYYVP
jgi:CSLREA domain-containing protein